MMYNLLEQPWLSVIYNNGVAARISLIEALSKAHQLQIAYPNPMDRIAVFRFILAMSLWCKQKTGDPIKDRIPPRWFSYLADQKPMFELYGDDKRFMQSRGLIRLRPVTELFHEVPTGNNAWHFHHSRDYGDGVCLHCIVNGILRLPVFSVSGLPDLKSGINGSPPIYCVNWPDNLLEALIQNWPSEANLGAPNWVYQYQYSPSDSVPLLAGLTVPARLLFLNDPVESKEACSACGEKPGHLVYSCLYESAGILENQSWKDPFAVYKDDRALKASNIVGTGKLAFDMRYRGLLSTILKDMSFEQSRSILIVGFAVDKAKYVDIWEKTLQIEPLAINPEILEILEHWNDSVKFTLNHKSLNRFKNFKASLASDLGPQTEAIFYKKLKAALRSNGLVWDDLSDSNQLATRIISKAMLPGISSKLSHERFFIRSSIPKVQQSKQKKGGEADEQQS
jgi:hypothetical protein